MDSQLIIILSLLALVITWCVYPWVLNIAKKHNIMDMPDNRKLQTQPVPVFGGAAVAVGIFIPLLILSYYFHSPFIGYQLVVMLCLMIIGIADDIKGLSATLRFVVELVLVWVLLWRTHLGIDNLHGLFGLPILSTYISLPLSLIAGVGIINSINLIDGVDGYSSGYGIFANSIFAVIFFSMGETISGLFSTICAAALLPFLLHNVFGKTSKMYIGDGGSLLIGFIMVCNVFTLLSQESLSGMLLHNKGIGWVALSLAILCIPVFDTIRVMCARIVQSTSPFLPDKTHLHHLFIDMGFSHAGTSITIILTNAAIVGIWYLSYLLGASINTQFIIVVLLGLLSTFGFYYTLRFCQRHNNSVWQRFCRLGAWTHFEHKGAWVTIQKIMDYTFIKK